jgi:hypothetical protein
MPSSVFWHPGHFPYSDPCDIIIKLSRCQRGKYKVNYCEGKQWISVDFLCLWLYRSLGVFSRKFVVLCFKCFKGIICDHL